MRKRPIPKPIISALREEFRSGLDGEIEGEDVDLLMADAKGALIMAFIMLRAPTS
jgi:hypothetical protein